MSQALVSLGPWGGECGSEWDYMFSGGLKRIIVQYGISCIYSIMFQDSTNRYSTRFGTMGGDCTKNVSIDCPYEYLVSFSGRYGPHDRIVSTVKYLMLETNVRSYSFGHSNEEDTYFSIPVKSGEFVGFHGRCSRLLDSIGLHLTPCSTTPAEASGSTAIARAPYVSNGPWGGQGGGQWSYEFVGQLNRIIIDHGTRIRSIMFEDSSGISEKFGGTGGKIAEVQFDLPREFVVGLRGSYGKLGASGPVLVKYLVIQTNLRTHGPFGTLNRDDRNEVEFTTPVVTSGRVVGFHGRCGLDLDSIGLLVMP